MSDKDDHEINEDDFILDTEKLQDRTHEETRQMFLNVTYTFLEKMSKGDELSRSTL